jgi:poly-gamma-glutamate capsule biosynthesis protein CapA/YwtB (metallophosphatase superfamily)
MGTDVVGLANNHIMDHEPSGLESTFETLKRTGIGHVGVGRNIGRVSAASDTFQRRHPHS